MLPEQQHAPITDNVVLSSFPFVASSADIDSQSEAASLVDERNDIGPFTGKIMDLSDTKKHQLLTNHWQPPKGYRFPYSEHTMQEKRVCRYFNQKYLDEFHWLVFSEHDKGAYCKFCVLFAIESDKKKLGMLVKSPLMKFSKLTGTDGVLSTHATKQYHERAMLVAQDFIMCYENPAEKIVNKISASRLKQAVENRAKSSIERTSG